MVMPTYGRGMHMKLGVGLWTFEKLTTVQDGERYQTWDRAEALAHEPALRGDALYGAVAFVEYLTDDARLVLANVKAAHRAGALCVNHAEVIALRAGEATVRDAFGGSERTVRARVVVNACGPWVEDICARAGVQGGPRLRLTKGVHLVVPHARLPIHNAVVMTTRDKRSVFAIPRDGMTYLGTTDTDFPKPEDHPAVTAADADYLLEAANRTFAGTPLTRADVVAAWAGLRPLLHQEGKAPSEVSRRDEMLTDLATGLISIAGGKLTGYRRMAERVVDHVCTRLGRRDVPCRTAEVPLPGGEPPDVHATRPSVALHLPPGGTERLAFLYGSECEQLLARVARDPAAGSPVPGLPQVLRAEVEHALDEEMALTLEDILERRTRCLLFDAHQGLEGVETVAAMAAKRLGWDSTRMANEIDGYRRLAASLRSFS
jgi:glycerol-3-phosphate dehydrogenase